MNIAAQQLKCPECGVYFFQAFRLNEATTVNCPNCKHQWHIYSGDENEEIAKQKLMEKANEDEIKAYTGEE